MKLGTAVRRFPQGLVATLKEKRKAGQADLLFIASLHNVQM